MEFIADATAVQLNDTGILLAASRIVRGSNEAWPSKTWIAANWIPFIQETMTPGFTERACKQYYLVLKDILKIATR